MIQRRIMEKKSSVMLDEIFITTSQTWTVPAGVRRIQAFLVGGGGGGGNWQGWGQCYGLGGGGGQCVLQEIQVSPNTQATISIGKGGSTLNAGNSTSLTIGGITYTANGGFAGENCSYDYRGRDYNYLMDKGKSQYCGGFYNGHIGVVVDKNDTTPSYLNSFDIITKDNVVLGNATHTDLNLTTGTPFLTIRFGIPLFFEENGQLVAAPGTGYTNVKIITDFGTSSFIKTYYNEPWRGYWTPMLYGCGGAGGQYTTGTGCSGTQGVVVIRTYSH